MLRRFVTAAKQLKQTKEEKEFFQLVDATKKNMNELILDFDELGVFPSVIANLRKNLGIFKPTQIQAEAISFILEGRDVLLRSQTGTGKTLGLLIALLSRKRRSETLIRQKNITKLIVAPTPHLVNQIYSWIACLSNVDRGSPEMMTVAQAFTPEGSELYSSSDCVPEIAIGTPNSLLRLLDERRIDLSHVKTSILDEVDILIPKVANKKHESPSISLIRAVQQISKVEKRQLVVASATVSIRTQQLLARAGLLERAVLVNCGVPFACANDISHSKLVLYDAAGANLIEKGLNEIDTVVAAVKRVYLKNEGKVGLLFVDSMASKMKLREALRRAAIEANMLTPAFTQKMDPGLYILSDCEGRGLDVPLLEYTILLGLPKTVHDYIHLAGRVGRMGRHGTVTTILRDEDEAAQLSRYISKLQLQLESFK